MGTDMFYCNECGKTIGTDVYNWTGYGEPLCDDCMIDNENGFVCPECGKKYRENDRGGSGQYCRFCEAKMDV